MMSLAVLNLPDILNALSFKKEKVLDIGGSRGLYSIALCRKNKDIDITIIDLEYSLVFFHFLGGQNYSFSEMSGWLKGYGFKKIKRKNLIKSGFSIIQGWK